jgi:hypothetical protein
MEYHYPDDADGDALRAVASLGYDMTKPMDIDFCVDVPDSEIGERVAELVSRSGYRTNLDYDKEDDAWTCYCTKCMVPTYEAVVGAQKELDELSGPLGGRSDGWGTFGTTA